MIEAMIFWTLAGLTLGGSLLVVTRRNPVAAALWLIVSLGATAGLFLTLGAHFLGVVQVLTYAGAIMVLFMFVIMLLNIRDAALEDIWGGTSWWFVAVPGAVILFAGSKMFHDALPADGRGEAAEGYGAIEAIAGELFGTYLLAFEAVSLLLLAGIVGVMLLARRPARRGGAE